MTELVALPVSVRCVLSVINKTVPMAVPACVEITFPIVSSVKNAVPVPVTAAETLDDVTFPVRLVNGHALVAAPLQLPLAVEVIDAASALNKNEVETISAKTAQKMPRKRIGRIARESIDQA